MTDNILLEFIRNNVKEDDVVLDIGCGIKTYQDVECKLMVSLDGWMPLYPDILANLEEGVLPISNNSIDVILIIDVIEHIEKINGLKIIDESKRVTRRSIILFTPLWWEEDPGRHREDLWSFANPYKYHKSLWSKEDFTDWNSVDIREKYYTGVWSKCQY